MALSPYQLIDSGNFRRLERLGDYLIIRPCLTAIWKPALPPSEWDKAKSEFERDSSGNGLWKGEKLPHQWSIQWGDFKMWIRPTRFGHLGLFPEHQKIWSKSEEIIQSFKQQNSSQDFQLLNLFAYTGGATLAAAAQGAHVTHVDGSKTSVEWAKENAHISDLNEAPIRWLVDDVSRFIKREIRRESRYHGVILDPPSFGRGPKNQVWKIEDQLCPLLEDIKELLHPDFHYVALSAHSTGFSARALENLMASVFEKSDLIESGELGVFDQNERLLPSGDYCLIMKQNK